MISKSEQAKRKERTVKSNLAIEQLNDPIQRRIWNGKDYADYSEDKSYRYVLRRAITVNFDPLVRYKKPIAFVMLNPSTATESKNDPTISRCVSFAQKEGYNRLYILNLFAFRSTDPKKLLTTRDPVGPLNNSKLEEIIPQVYLNGGPIVVAWGANRLAQEKGVRFVEKFTMPLYCLGTTKNGSPRHPLYVKSSQRLVPYR